MASPDHIRKRRISPLSGEFMPNLPRSPSASRSHQPTPPGHVGGQDQLSGEDPAKRGKDTKKAEDADCARCRLTAPVSPPPSRPNRTGPHTGPTRDTAVARPYRCAALVRTSVSVARRCVRCGCIESQSAPGVRAAGAGPGVVAIPCRRAQHVLRGDGEQQQRKHAHLTRGHGPAVGQRNPLGAGRACPWAFWPDCFGWTVLDRLVNGARQARQRLLHLRRNSLLGRPRRPLAPCTNGSSCSPVGWRCRRSGSGPRVRYALSRAVRGMNSPIKEGELRYSGASGM